MYVLYMVLEYIPAGLQVLYQIAKYQPPNASNGFQHHQNRYHAGGPLPGLTLFDFLVANHELARHSRPLPPYPLSSSSPSDGKLASPPDRPPSLLELRTRASKSPDPIFGPLPLYLAISTTAMRV